MLQVLGSLYVLSFGQLSLLDFKCKESYFLDTPDVSFLYDLVRRETEGLKVEARIVSCTSDASIIILIYSLVTDHIIIKCRLSYNGTSINSVFTLTVPFSKTSPSHKDDQDSGE